MAKDQGTKLKLGFITDIGNDAVCGLAPITNGSGPIVSEGDEVPTAEEIFQAQR